MRADRYDSADAEQEETTQTWAYNSVMRADHQDGADAEQGETTRTQDSKHSKCEWITNEPYLFIYRNERGTSITVVRPIIDTWQ